MTDETKRVSDPGSPPLRTRDRILVAALALFNQKGPDRVTTAEIARTVHINEGNLYYHFRTKEALILALFAQFEGEAGGLVQRAGKSPSDEPRTYSDFLKEWFSLAWNYRFFFRDLLGLAAAMPALKEPIIIVSSQIHLAVEGLVHQMVEERLVVVPQHDMASLLANVWIVSTYWAVYLGIQKGIDHLEPGHLDWGLNQVSSLFRPYLTAKAVEGASD